VLTVLSITGPIFMLIAIGYVAVRLGLIQPNNTRALGVFVIDFALPALLFRALSKRSNLELLNPDLLLSYALGSFLMLGLGIGFGVFVQRRGLQASTVFAMGMVLSNSAFMGFPIAEELIGAKASAALAVYVMVENLFMLPILIGCAELGRKSGSHWAPVIRGILVRLIKNPLILAILSGVICSLLDVPIVKPLGKTIDLLAGSSAPVALFYIGCTLAGLTLKGMVTDITSVVIGKLLFHPLCVFLLFLLLPLEDPTLTQSAIINAAMPMATIYPLLGQKYGYEGVCSAALVATTVISFFTVTGVLYLAQSGFF